jgi:hypothetical protein
VDSLSSTPGVVALVAGAIALISLGLAVFLAFRVRALRTTQRAVLGEYGEQDVVQHASMLQRSFIELRDWVDDTSRGIEERVGVAEHRIDTCVNHCAVVRYDAYGEMSGRQSSSLALLDAAGDGVVLSCITHRDTARLYTKAVHEGRGEHELSPEEDEAIRLALAGETHSATLE